MHHDTTTNPVIEGYRSAYQRANGQPPRITEERGRIIVNGGTSVTLAALAKMTRNLAWRDAGNRQH